MNTTTKKAAPAFGEPIAPEEADCQGETEAITETGRDREVGAGSTLQGGPVGQELRLGPCCRLEAEFLLPQKNLGFAFKTFFSF